MLTSTSSRFPICGGLVAVLTLSCIGDEPVDPCKLQSVGDAVVEQIRSPTTLDLYAVNGLAAVGEGGTVLVGSWDAAPSEIELRSENIPDPIGARAVVADLARTDQGARLVVVGEAGGVWWETGGSPVWERAPVSVSESMRFAVRLQEPPHAWIAVGENVVVLRTEQDPDEPASEFQVVELSSVYDLWAVDVEPSHSSRPWAVGSEGVILRSDDRGLTWTEFGGPGNVDLRFLSAPLNGPPRGYEQERPLWVGGPGGELWSIDVYASDAAWKRQFLPTDVDLFGMSFGEGTVWVVGAEGMILRRVEGAAWELVETPTPNVTFHGISQFWRDRDPNRQTVVGSAGTILSVSAPVTWSGECLLEGL